MRPGATATNVGEHTWTRDLVSIELGQRVHRRFLQRRRYHNAALKRHARRVAHPILFAHTTCATLGGSTRLTVRQRTD